MVTVQQQQLLLQNRPWPSNPPTIYIQHTHTYKNKASTEPEPGARMLIPTIRVAAYTFNTIFLHTPEMGHRIETYFGGGETPTLCIIDSVNVRSTSSLILFVCYYLLLPPPRSPSNLQHHVPPTMTTHNHRQPINQSIDLHLCCVRPPCPPDPPTNVTNTHRTILCRWSSSEQSAVSGCGSLILWGAWKQQQQ